MKHHAGYALIAAAAALAACGGGGTPPAQQPPAGQDNPPQQQPADQDNPPQQQPVDQGEATQPADLARQLNTGAGRAGISERARAAANAIPRMGSVTQSSNVDSRGITTDTASATFDGTRMSLTINHQGGTSTQASATTSDFDSGIRSESLFDGHNSGQWLLARENDGRYQALFATISYNPSDDTDWLAGGLLITADGSSGPVGAGNINQIAWIDGPEISRNVDLTGASGTATYSGPAFGNYTATSSGGVLEVGAFRSGLQLTANFGTNTVSGCVGCGGRGVLLSPYYDSRGDPQSDDTPRPLEFRLGQIDITNTGIFNNGDVAIQAAPGEQIGGAGETIQGQSGKWGGRFSARLQDGRPRAAAVAFGGSFDIVYSGGTNSDETNAIVYQGISLPTPPGS